MTSKSYHGPVRGRSVVLLGAGVIVLLVNHLSAVFAGKVFPILLLISAFGIVLGSVSLLSPKAELALRRDGQHLPLRYKLAGLASIFVALGVWVALWLFVYPTEDLEPFMRWISR